MSLHQFLKKETREVHARVEKELQAKQLLKGTFSVEFWEGHLQTLWNAHLPLGAALKAWTNASLLTPFWPKEDFVDRLKADLEQFKHPPINLNLRIELGNEWMALGALYLIRGSNLGRAHIAKAVDPRLKELNLGQSVFYDLSNRSDLESWPQFVSDMQALSATEKEQQWSLEGAKLGFSLFMEASQKLQVV